MTQRAPPSLPLPAYFNPHEREARDQSAQVNFMLRLILIHTSVKLVTKFVPVLEDDGKYFNPHEREARDAVLLERSSPP